MAAGTKTPTEIHGYIQADAGHILANIAVLEAIIADTVKRAILKDAIEALGITDVLEVQTLYLECKASAVKMQATTIDDITIKMDELLTELIADETLWG